MPSRKEEEEGETVYFLEVGNHQRECDGVIVYFRDEGR